MKVRHQMGESDWVTVNFWLTEASGDLGGHKVGHVSIETSEGYYSFWPFMGVTHVKERVPATYQLSYDDDVVSLGGSQANFRITLYSLKPPAIAIADRKLSTAQFRLTGQSSVNRGVHNCTTYAMALLKAAGLYSLLTSGTSGSSLSSTAKNPDNLFEALRKAKLTEVKKHPETSEYLRVGDSRLDLLQEVKAQYIKSADIARANKNAKAVYLAGRREEGQEVKPLDEMSSSSSEEEAVTNNM